MKVLTLDDFDLKGKTVFLRVDMNCPIDPETMEISGTKRIEEAIETLKSLEEAKVVVASHQGRVGNKDYTGMDKHAKVLEKLMGKKIKYVEDVIGSAAQNEIKNLKNGEILLLDNLRLCAEENYEFTQQEAANTIMVSRLSKLFDLCVLDSFPSAHRSHPSIVGFPYVLPACAGRIVEREVRNLDEIMTVAKAPHVIVLGGSKVPDRLEAIKLLIQNGRADHVLLTGLIGNVFMRAQGRIRYPLGIKREDEVVSKAHALIGEYPDVFSTPVDIAIDKDGDRVEMDVRELEIGDKIYDLGPKTVEHYSKLIAGAGTVFISGPAGFFEKENFSFGTKSLLTSVANSMATTIVSGGHLTSALKKYGLAEQIDHISTAGGALVLYLTGERLPMIKALEDAAIKYRELNR
ncbi:MAG: phosphoglycerate kinase [Nitrosopumilales archaeon CG11_big_fil_rev_8_21_14_0_20_33_24]|nr:MAG: phosphoglycerate kinase [Nitrosopumilales archaeon CG11_big_fil_rev_8_21_14_0_20_33_24]PIY88655.1 MAG: phosphoglycerate kinase [Nitrosopumilales archaeon CG_4_10_14_0_8_um_filter_34_8]PJB97070.1 MAG: phosphoglycerate kinase [Nitrosopumilales archaeon CG_4_9_14_0_8_um_filter_34_10]